MAMRRGGDGNDAFQTAFFTHQTQHEDGYDVLQRTRPHQINPMSGSFLNNRTGIADQESQDFTVERLDARFDCLVENLPIWKTSPRSIAARASRRSVESLVLKVTDPNEAGFLQVDKELESIQTLCENAAHQIPRGGDCTTELDKILSQAEVVWHQAADTAASSKMLKQEQQEYPFRPGLIRSRVYSFVELSWAHLRLRPTTVEVDDAGGQDSVKLDLTRSDLGESETYRRPSGPENHLDLRSRQTRRLEDRLAARSRYDRFIKAPSVGPPSNHTPESSTIPKQSRPRVPFRGQFKKYDNHHVAEQYERRRTMPPGEPFSTTCTTK
ncbi:hypothetical protein LTS17_008555 [Exophiala oligosperma]